MVDARNEYQPMRNVDAGRWFGTEGAPKLDTQGPWVAPTSGQHGTGMRGLPETFRGWEPAARYAFAPAMDFTRMSGPILDFLKQSMGKDWQGQLYSKGAEQADVMSRNMRSANKETSTRTGTAGGGITSPVASMNLALEEKARAGLLGEAARQSVLGAQQMKMQSAQAFQDYLTNLYKVWMRPAELQAARRSSAPLTGEGPSLVGSGTNMLSGLFEMLQGMSQ